MRFLLISNMSWSHTGETNRQAWVHGLSRWWPGCEIDFVETVGWRATSPGATEFVVNGAALRVIPAQNVVPWAAQSWNRPGRAVNYRLTRRQLRPDYDVAISFDPFSCSLIKGLAHRAIYDCLDHYDEQPQYSSRMARRFLNREERRLATSVDQVWASSQNLTRRPSFSGIRVHFRPGTLSPPVWGQEALQHRGDTQAPLRGVYIGALDRYKVDLSVFQQLAGLGSDLVNVRVIGGTEFSDSRAEDDSASLQALPNVTMEGALERSRLLEVLGQADFGIVSMSDSRYSSGSFPLKYWDYQWAGLPTLAVRASSLRGMPCVVHVDRTELIDSEILTRLAKLSLERETWRQHARDNDVTARVAAILA